MMRELVTLGEMWSHLRWSRQQIVEYQGQRLRALVAHAYANVPYYRALFDRAGLKPQDVRGVGDLPKIPMTSKADIQNAPPGSFIARGIDPKSLIVRMSGGSTGEPKPIRRTWYEERLLNAFRFRARWTVGMRPSDRIASVGMLRTPQAADRQTMSKLLNRVGLFRVQKVDCLQPVAQIVRDLEKIQPDMITGYPGTISLAAAWMLENGRRGAVRPRIITTGAEVQTPLMRQQITDAFGVRPFNFYGAHEFNQVAWECPQTGQMHTCDDLLIAEILRGGRLAAPGERGELVGTNLHVYSMPFIRFRLDDLVTRGADSCPCGLPFSTISAVQGRMLDYFPLPNGRLLHPYEIYDRVMHDRAEWARRYQLVQERRDLVVFSAVASNMPSPQRLEQMHKAARDALGPGVEFRIEFVEEIPADPNGKFRVSRSRVHSHYDNLDWERVIDAR